MLSLTCWSDRQSSHSANIESMCSHVLDNKHMLPCPPPADSRCDGKGGWQNRLLYWFYWPWMTALLFFIHFHHWSWFIVDWFFDGNTGHKFKQPSYQAMHPYVTPPVIVDVILLSSCSISMMLAEPRWMTHAQALAARAGGRSELWYHAQVATFSIFLIRNGQGPYLIFQRHSGQNKSKRARSM